MIAAIILALQLAAATFEPWIESPQFKEWFAKAKVGDTYSYSYKSDCNTCSGSAVKISETQMNVGPAVWCTLASCVWSNVITVVDEK